MRKTKDTVIAFFITIFSFLIPKKKDKYVFLLIHNRNQFSGNIRAMCEYAVDNLPSVDWRLVSFSEKVKQQTKQKGIPLISKKIQGYWNILRAEFLIIDAAVPFYSKGRFSFIQLWHGVGFKNIGLLNNTLSERYKNKLKKHYQQYRLILSTSKDDQQKQNESFGTTVTKITGYPRNDLFFNQTNKSTSLIEKLNLNEKFQYFITYAPTFREKIVEYPFSEGFWDELNSYLTKINGVFLVKKHPWDKLLKIPTHYPNILDVTQTVDEIQKLLVITDLLITDYSAISTDFVLTNRPIAFYCYDYEEYTQNNRTLYYNLKEILPKPFITDEIALSDFIKNQEKGIEHTQTTDYKTFKNRFHYYQDGDSAKRVWEEIRGLNKTRKN